MLLKILTLLGSLAMFLYGMSLMSGGLQKMAGNRLRSIMAKMTSNYFTCILTGIVVTAMVQSSTATTLLIVSFVNAGLLALGSAIAVIMGANIGTTVTAWIFALSFGGGSWSISAIAIPLMFIAFLCMNAASLIAEYGIIEKAPVAQKALPKCGVTCLTGSEMEAAMKGYLEVLFQADPSSVGGEAPDAGFYYSAKK